MNLTNNVTAWNWTIADSVLHEETLPPLRFWLYLANLLVYAVEFPVSLFSALTVLSSAVLHPNLKLVLVCQNACFFLFALVRTLQTALIFKLGPNSWAQFKSIQCGVLFSTLYGNLIGHVLLLERLMATFFVRDYEQKQKLWFPVCWFPLLFTFTLVNAYTETYQSAKADASLDITVSTIASLIASMLMSFAEIFILSLMGVHNRKAYLGQRNCRQQGTKSLTERYQLSENIRTAKQLGPTFLFHFANICCTTILGVCMYWSLVEDVFTLMAVAFLCISIFNTGIELSVIIRHPILRRSAKASLLRWLPSSNFVLLAPGNKVQPQASCATVEQNEQRIKQQQQPKTIDGQWLIHTPATDDYFRIFAKSWDSAPAETRRLTRSSFE